MSVRPRTLLGVTDANAAMWSRLPTNLTDTDVVGVEVLPGFRVRVTHRDGTVGVHLFAPEDFRGVSLPLRDPAVFAKAQVVDHTLGWVMADGSVFDQAPDTLWLHARGFCDGSCGHPPTIRELAQVELTREVEGFPAGTVGTVVGLYGTGGAEVEVFGAAGETVGVVTVDVGDLRAV